MVRYTVYVIAGSDSCATGGMNAWASAENIDDARRQLQLARGSGRRAALVRLDRTALFPDPPKETAGIEIVERG